MDVFTTGLPNLLTVTPWTVIKSRLKNLYLVPLMYYFELIITIFQVNSLKNPSHRHFNVLNFVKIQDSNTRTSDKLSSSTPDLLPNLINNSISTESLDYGTNYH